ncbi:MAG: tetratricopeptide repeat protein, partial [Pseudomonadota bacterium]
LAYCYTQVRKPEEAVSYLRERAVSREIYTAALGRMSSRLRVGEHHAAAADATRELLRYAPDDGERLHDARMLHSLVIQSETYQRVGDDVSLILQAMRRRVLQPDLTAEQRAQLMEEFELLARDLSTRAQKSTGAFTDEPPAENAPTDTQVIAAYDAYLTYLPASPYRLEIVQNLADALGSDDQYLAAGHRYLEAADLCLAREDAEEGCREEALYSSVFAYREHLERNKIQRFTEQVTARAGLRVAGGLYLEEAEPEVDTAVKIKFAIASTYYDEGNYLEAIDLLTALAYQYPQTEQGTAAVNMALDSMRAIDDIDSLIGAGQRFLSEDSPFAQALQDDIKPILAAAEQRQIDAYSLAAAGDDVGGVDALMAFVDRYEGTSLGERALLNSFMSARAQGDTAQLYEIGEKFLDDYKTSEQSAGVATTLGQTAAARFEYDRAITYFERAANLNPEQGPALMFTVGTLKEQLGDLSGAAEVYQRLLNDGERKREAAVRVADIQMAQRQYDSAVRTLSPFAGSGDPEALSRLGMAMLQTGDIFEAENHFLAVTQSPGAASGTAISRAAYGQAEVSMSMLESYEPSPGLEAIEESIGLIDLVVQGYLQAARQPDPVYAQAALARLARAAEIGAEIMGGIEIPPEIGADDRTILEDAILVRATQLTEASQEALAECANHAQIHFLFDDSGKACLSGAPPKQNPVQPQKLSPRKRVAQPAGIDAVLEKVARNNDDVDAIREAGEAYLGA